MTKYSQGLGWNGPKVPVYDGGEDPTGGINLEALDLSEREDMLRMVNERVIALRHEMAESQKPKKLKQENPPGSLPAPQPDQPDENASPEA